ncbi:glycosyltransferase [Bosea sp. WAO]|uniref:glycosyltransferase n=1 Tax=Bosea sp. WAO TaxID=406341 RepID=UPI0008371BFE|nr:glycosyltransferase [Bosea sp. WAO]
MKLLVVSNMYPSTANPVGGIFVHEQVKALRRAGIDARVASGKPLWLSGRRPRNTLRVVRSELSTRRKGFAWVDYDGVPTVSFNYFAGAFARPWLYPWIYRSALMDVIPNLAGDFPYELVHTHTAFLDGRAGAAAARFRSVPMVLTEHTGPFSLVTDDWRFRQHTLAGMNGADRIIAVSSALRTEITRRLPAIGESRIDVVPNGVDTRFFDPAIANADASPDPACDWANALARSKRELVLYKFIAGFRLAMLERGEEPVSGSEVARAIELALLAGVGEGPYADDIEGTAPTPLSGDAQDEDCVNVLWVGHLVDVKRVDRLLEAFAIAQRRVPALRLRLVGGGELGASLKQQAGDLGLGKVVTFVPTKSRQGIRKEMAAADLLVISSETETFGVVGIEAMAMGLPVLTTDCGGPADYVNEPRYGELVPNNTEDLAIGLQRIAARIAGFDKAELRRHAVENFDFDLVARKLAGIYREMLQREPLQRAAA